MYLYVFVDGEFSVPSNARERCIYTREIIAIGGALVSSRYIDLASLPNTEDFLLRRAAATANPLEPLSLVVGLFILPRCLSLSSLSR